MSTRSCNNVCNYYFANDDKGDNDKAYSVYYDRDHWIFCSYSR